ncbi:DNA-binding protein [Candidatus Riflebacteria bacterium]
MANSISREELLIEELKDPEFAVTYLNECLNSIDGETPEMTKNIFLKSLRRVIQAQGMSKISRLAGLNRANLYQQIKEEGQPGFDTVLSILNSLDINIRLVPKKKI